MKSLSSNIDSLENKEWQALKIESIFNVEKGIYLNQKNITLGNLPYISAKATNNGLNTFIGNNKLNPLNKLTSRTFFKS